MTMIINNETSTEKIESLYFPLIDEALSIYQEIFQDALIEIRLLGSVPRGEAHPGSSDIDFMALIREKSREASLSLLQESSRRLQSTYLFVSQVDLDCFDVASLSPFQRFVLSSDSLSIYGKDEFNKKSSDDQKRTFSLIGHSKYYRSCTGIYRRYPLA